MQAIPDFERKTRQKPRTCSSSCRARDSVGHLLAPKSSLFSAKNLHFQREESLFEFKNALLSRGRGRSYRRRATAIKIIFNAEITLLIQNSSCFKFKIHHSSRTCSDPAPAPALASGTAADSAFDMQNAPFLNAKFIIFSSNLAFFNEESII